jgi:HD-GYP domain-containing protein (c-di-GMP phosphodiesterase class II)
VQELDKQAALRMVTLFSGAVKGMAFYPASHPAIRQQLLELDRSIADRLRRVPTFSWVIVDGALIFDDHLFIAPSVAVVELVNRMMEKEIGSITFSAGLALAELQGFVRLLAIRKFRIDEIRSDMELARIEHIRLLRQGEESAEAQDGDEPEEEGAAEYRVVYGNALGAIRGVCRDILQGRIPSSEPVLRVVDRMAAITMRDPSTLLGLSMIKDYDDYTFTHCVNVGVLAMALGASIGLDGARVRELGIAGQLHDIGKTMVPKHILNKPGKLSSLEFEEIKRHPELGFNIIQEMDGLSRSVARVVLGHHVHSNRDGYPAWARTLSFDRMVDIVAVADTYDAATTLRVYQFPVTPRAALVQLEKMAGTLLDAEMVKSFSGMMGKYPVGTLVRLDTNEVAVVFRPNPLDEETPLVRVLFDAAGTLLKTPRDLHLAQPDGSRYAGIVAVVDPLLKNIDVGKYVMTAER